MTMEEKLIKAGGNLWEKYGKKRIYFPKELGCEILKLKIRYARNGDVIEAKDADGDHISLAEARRWTYTIESTFFDCLTGTLVTKMERPYPKKVSALQEAIRERFQDDSI